MNKFDIKSTDLDGSSMLEASAGTGKTYSVAILVLRLILEKNIPIDKILMVTFTNAAVAELELRIRKFVRLAFRYASTSDICDEEIMNVVDQAGKELSITELKIALQSLDNLSVMTIHSFCQKTIGEFTFETDQSFDYEIVTEDAFILKNATNRFVRENLNVLDYEQFKEIIKDLKVEKMDQLLRKHLQGMKFIDSKLEQGVDLEKVKKRIKEKNEEFDSFIRSKFPEIIAMQNKDALAKEAAKGDVSEFKRRFNDQVKKASDYFKDYKYLVDDFVKHQKEVSLAESELYNYFYINFFQQSEKQINETKQKKGYISYDDQIKTIHATLVNRQFISYMKEKYDAVFIDEFQDTDKYQYEIFSKVFEGNTLFYIGDPKQSIYGWRSADLDTYKAAKDKVGEKNIHTLGRNFRSTPGLLKALEKLMNPGNGFNMFLDDKIKFEKVEAGNHNLGDMEINGKKVAPITIWQFDTNDFETSNTAVAQEIYNLLNGNTTINGKKIKPQDIGILVRENSDGRDIKKALAEFNIPSVQRDDTKVLKSDEATLVSYLITATLNPKRGEILRVINSNWFGFSSEALETLDEQIHIGYFLELRNILQKEGIFNMISRFLEIYGVRQNCASDVLGQRVLTNINQIAEILHRLERKAKLLPEELIVWLRRAVDDGSEEYQQRIESDADAVQISTIHKAKGLQYKIVFAPGLCMIPKYKLLEKNKVNTFKKERTYYFTFNYPGLSEDDKKLHDLEKEQENQRLIYVALTRAAYKCYISYMPRVSNRKEMKSSFDDLFSKLDRSCTDIELVDLTNGQLEKVEGKYKQESTENKAFSPRPATLTTEDVKVPLQVHSFSALNSRHYSAPFEKQELAEAYDQFIFQDLPRGANVGTALHSIFERLDFSNHNSWAQTLTDSAKYYPNILKEEWMDHFQALVQHTMGVDISPNGESFRLSQITRDKMLPELQFNFSMEQVNKTVINEYLDEEAYLGGDATLQGMMTGFVDLLFEHNGKYYILDWKSNHLGNTLEDYNKAALAAAMKGSNYNLQYMIYTIAVKRWLESRLPDFDYGKHFGGVIYLFLRGVRQGSETGIFTAMPPKDVIESLDEAFYRESGPQIIH